MDFEGKQRPLTPTTADDLGAIDIRSKVMTLQFMVNFLDNQLLWNQRLSETYQLMFNYYHLNFLSS